MNALKLYHGLKARDVYLDVDGVNLKVDAPAGVLTEEDRTALLAAKPALLTLLARHEKPAGGIEDIPKSRARWAGPGWIRLFDPVERAWHEVPSSMCLPGVIAEADAHRKRRKGGAA